MNRKRTKPRITVILPVYNAEKFIAHALDSILGQTFKDFILYAIDDGSSDKSRKILADYAQRDPRIRVIRNSQNLGLVRTLNKGLKLVTTEFIARMDADDISLPDRFEKQLELLQSRPNVGVCGSWTYIFTKVPHIGFRYNPDLQDEQIPANFLFENAMQHPTVMMRTKILNGVKYPASYPHAEDYALWAQLATKTKFAILPKVLLQYRLHGEQVGKVHANLQGESVSKVHEHFLLKLRLKPSKLELALHEQICLGSYKRDQATLEKIEMWLMKLKRANQAGKCFSNDAFSQVIAKKWFSVCVSSSELGVLAWNKYWQSSLQQKSVISLRQYRYFFLETKFFPFLRPLVKRVKNDPRVKKVLRG